LVARCNAFVDRVSRKHSGFLRGTVIFLETSGPCSHDGVCFCHAPSFWFNYLFDTFIRASYSGALGRKMIGYFEHLPGAAIIAIKFDYSVK
jgi:hypothetical protein